MASTFINAGIQVGATATTLYTCPVSTAAVIHSLFVANVDGTNSADVDIEVSIDGGTTFRYLAFTVPVPAQSTLIFDKPINLEASDVIRLTASAASDLEAFASILEVS